LTFGGAYFLSQKSKFANCDQSISLSVGMKYISKAYSLITYQNYDFFILNTEFFVPGCSDIWQIILPDVLKQKCFRVVR